MAGTEYDAIRFLMHPLVRLSAQHILLTVLSILVSNLVNIRWSCYRRLIFSKPPPFRFPPHIYPRAGEAFMLKGKSFAGFPLTITWYSEPFPDSRDGEPEEEPRALTKTIRNSPQSRSSPSPPVASFSSRSSSPPAHQAAAEEQYPASLKLAQYPASLTLASTAGDGHDYHTRGLANGGSGGKGDVGRMGYDGRDYGGQGWEGRKQEDDQEQGVYAGKLGGVTVFMGRTVVQSSSWLCWYPIVTFCIAMSH